jgi:outer membrane protein OmpA-like peptidoglycan-associated protein
LLKLLSKTFIKYPNLIIVIEGFTDDVGDENYNQQLSEKRAKSVADVLYGMGISKRQAHYQGLGGLDPLVPNDSEENRSKNRRVEIRLYFVDSGKK